MTITLSLGALVVILLSAALFIAVTLFCHFQGLFDGNGSLMGGIDTMFATIFYAVG